MAQIEHDRQNDREAALEHLRLVLSGDPDHPGAITMLEGMLDDIAVQGQAAELLEPVYAGRADWKALIKIGEIRLVQTEDPAARLSWTKRIARLFEEQLEDYDSALRWYGKVFQEAPTERLSLEQLVRLADKLDRWADLASLLSNYLEGELGEEPAVIDIVRRTAEIFDHRLGQRPEAEKYYRRLFDARPDDRDAAQLFEAALERWGAWQELRELIDEEAGRAVDPAAKLALLRRSAKLDEEKLDSRGRAIGTLREAMDVDPADRGTAAELERLLGAEGQWHELSDHLAATLDRISDAREADAVRLRLARILYEKLDDVAASVDRYAEVLERTPGQPNAVSALESLAGTDAERHRIAVILEPVYRQSGDLGKLVAALEAQLESLDDRTDRVRILREMAEIHQRLGRPERAFECRSRAWLTDVESGETLAEMEQLGLAGGLHGRAGRHPREGRRRGGRPEPAGAAVGDDRPAARGSAGPRRRRDRGVAVGAVGAPGRSGRVPGPGTPAVRRGALAGAGRRSREAPRDHARRRRAQGDREAHRGAVRRRAEAARAGGSRLGDGAGDRSAGRRRAGSAGASCTRPAAPTAS